MKSKWALLALLFSVTVNIAVVGTLVYFWGQKPSKKIDIQIRDKNMAQNHLKWFHTPNIEPQVVEEIDSMRKKYRNQLQIVRRDIDSQRTIMVTLLLTDPVSRDSLRTAIDSLVEKQKKAEELTVDHLLNIKPLLPREEWMILIKDLEPRRIIHTEIIKMDKRDSTGFYIEKKEIEKIHERRP